MTPEQAGTLRAVLEALVQSCHERHENPKSNLVLRGYSAALLRAELYLSMLALLDIQQAAESIPTADPVGVDLRDFENVVPIRGLRH